MKYNREINPTVIPGNFSLYGNCSKRIRVKTWRAWETPGSGETYRFKEGSNKSYPTIEFNKLPCLIPGTVKLVDITKQSLGLPLHVNFFWNSGTPWLPHFIMVVTSKLMLLRLLTRALRAVFCVHTRKIIRFCNWNVKTLPPNLIYS